MDVLFLCLGGCLRFRQNARERGTVGFRWSWALNGFVLVVLLAGPRHALMSSEIERDY